MKKLLLLFSCISLFSFSDIRTQSQTEFQLNTDSLITAIVSKVNPDSIRYIVQSLQDFQTRFLLAPNRFSVADWIENRFHQIGVTDVERDSFMCHTNYMIDTTTLEINIVATIPGTTRPGTYGMPASADLIRESSTASELGWQTILPRISTGSTPEKCWLIRIPGP